MNIILSTCGTSILTNRVDENLRASLTRHANAKDETAIRQNYPEEHQSITNHIPARWEQFVNYLPSEAAKHSAELAGKGRHFYLLCPAHWFEKDKAADRANKKSCAANHFPGKFRAPTRKYDTSAQREIPDNETNPEKMNG